MSSALPAPTSDEALPIFKFSDGRSFVASQKLPPPVGVPDSPFWKKVGDEWVKWDEADFMAWFTPLWHEAYEFKRPETARLQRNAYYRDGFHYEHAWINQTTAIENHVWRVIETQVANTVANRPRPEVRPTGPMSGQIAQKIERYARVIEEGANYDHAVNLGARDKRTFGWNVWLMTFDYATGMPALKPYSVFDFYWDPAGRDEDECQYFIFARPIPTRILRATYPDYEEKILPDTHASPADEACVKSWNEFLDHYVSGYSPPLISEGAYAVHNEGDNVTEGTTLVADTGYSKQHGMTTFTFQILFRDHGLMPCPYLGTMTYPEGHPDHPVGGDVPGMKYEDTTPRCPSGLWMVTLTAGGCVLCVEQLDECYMGLNFVIDRAAQVTDRFVSMCDTDQAIPIQRGINRRGRVLDNSLEVSGNPPVLDFQSGIQRQLNSGTVNAGDVLEAQRGSEVRFMEFAGPSQQHFERMSESKQAIQEVTGTHSALEGESVGANSAAANTRTLASNSMRRLQGGENPAHRARALALRKLLYMAGKKLQPEIMFRATDGEPETISSEELLMGFNIGYAQGTGSIEAKQDLKDEALALYDRGAIDELSLLDTVEWPDYIEVAARVQQQKMMRAAQQAAATAGSNPPGGGKQ